MPKPMRPQIATDGELYRRHKIPNPHKFAVSLQAYVNKAAFSVPLLVMWSRKTCSIKKKH
jgi:hypothetical protein